MPVEPSDLVAAHVVALRRLRGWTVRDLAARCPSLTAAMITNIEGGRRDSTGRRRKHVTAEELVSLAAAFGVSPEIMLQADPEVMLQRALSAYCDEGASR